MSDIPQDEDVRFKNVITWKDADQNLCTIAAYMLSEAMKALRGVRDIHDPVQTDEWEWIFPGFGEGDGEGSLRTIFSGDYSPFDLFPAQDDKQPCPQCWWCFQNMITQELRKARLELSKNLYGQNRAFKSSRQRSRNPSGRSMKSKFQRTPERE